MYISGGENVFPGEVEAVLCDAPDVAEAAVVGVPDAKWGEVGRAIVAPRAGSNLTEAEVLAFLDGKLARYKIPKSVVFVPALPRNPTGKVLRRTLQELT